MCDCKFVVITEIYYNGIKVSRHRCEKKTLYDVERNQLIRTLFLQKQASGNYLRKEIYKQLEADLIDDFQIDLSKRSIMRIITEPPIEISAKEYQTLN